MNSIRRFIPFFLDNTIWFLLVPVVIFFVSLENNFFTVNNLISILSYAAIMGIIAIGQSFTLITGNFDLSQESTVGLCGLMGVWLIGSAGDPLYGSGLMLPVWLTIPILMLLGLAIGWINGNLITRYKVNNFIVTLGMLIAIRGITYVISYGATVFSDNKLYNSFGGGTIWIVNYPILFMLALFVVFYVVLKYTKFGRELYAVGANRKAALASGVNPDVRIRQVYLISGVLAAFAGFLLSARLTNVMPTMGKGMIFEVTAAAVIGGISLQGGRGSLIGVFGGVLLLSAINSGLNLMEVSVFWIDVIRGLVILIAMFIDAQKSRIMLFGLTPEKQKTPGSAEGVKPFGAI